MDKKLLPRLSGLLNLGFLLFLIPWTSCPGDEIWLEDVATGLEKAQREKKDGLILFTGSDWCPPCIKLEQEILSKPEFLAAVEPQFVLIKLDFPRNSPQPEKIAEQNKIWAKEYGVDAFPTLLLVDASGKPFAVAGFSDEGVASYLEMLERNRQLRIARDEKLKIADQKIGLQRAQALDEAISLMNEELVSAYYPEMVAEILELDKKDELGLRTKWNSAGEAELRRAVLTDIMLISRIEKPDRAIAFIDEVLSDLEFPVREHLAIMTIKLNLLRETASQTGDLNPSVQWLDQMANLDGITSDTRDRLLVKKINLFFEAGQQDRAWQILEQGLQTNPRSVYLHKAKGDFLEAVNQLEQAATAYSAAIETARSQPDVLIEVVSAKADVLFDQGKEAEALATLDSFIDDDRQPADLRAQGLLHKSLIMRETDRIRQARLAENRAVEISQSAQSKREVQNLVDKIRAKYGD